MGIFTAAGTSAVETEKGTYKQGGLFLEKFSELYAKSQEPVVVQPPSPYFQAYQTYIKSKGQIIDRLASPCVSECLAGLADAQFAYSMGLIFRTIPTFVNARWSLYQLSDAQNEVAIQFFKTKTSFGSVLNDSILRLTVDQTEKIKSLCRENQAAMAFIELVQILADPTLPRSPIAEWISKLLIKTL